MYFLLPFLWLSFFASVPTPVDFVPTPVDTVRTPVDSVRTPVDSVWAPVDRITTEPTGIIVASDDGGTVWRDLSSELPPNKGMVLLKSIEDQLYLGVNGILYTSSGKENPKWKKEKFSPGVIIDLFPGKTGPYAITQQKGFFQQNEKGNWEPVFQNMNDKIVFAFEETSDEGLLASTDHGIYKSSDNGQTWRHVLITNSIQSLTGDKDVYLVATKEGIWRSADEGEHWTHVLTTATYATRISSYQDGYIAIVMGQEFGGIRTSNELYASGDRGATWKKMEVPDDLDNVFEVEQAGTILMASGEKGIFSSSDQGKSWKFVHKAPENKNKFYRLVSLGKTIFALRIQGC